MDAALLLVAGNENCPQPQTSEHLAAVEIMQLKNIIILQNKIDLVKQDAALAHYDQIKAFISGTVAGNAPIIPISAQLKYNMDYLCKYIIETVSTFLGLHCLSSLRQLEPKHHILCAQGVISSLEHTPGLFQT